MNRRETNFTNKNKKKNYFADRVNHKPIIENKPQNQTLTIGTNATLKCKVLSDLHLHIQWVFGTCNNCSQQVILKVMDSEQNTFKCMRSFVYLKKNTENNAR